MKPLLQLSALLLVSTAMGDVGQAPKRHGTPKIIKVPMEQQGDVLVPGYAAFPIPPFAVTFKTINTLSGDPEVDAALLQSEMASPLKEVVGRYVKESFEIETAILSSSAEATANNPATNELLMDFVSLDFQVSIRHRFTQDPKRHRRRLVERDLESVLSPDGTVWYLDFYAEFVGTAYFLAPPSATSELPTDGEMFMLMQTWLNRHLDDLAAILNGFQSSSSAILNNVQSLTMDTNIRVGDVPEKFQSNSGDYHEEQNDGSNSGGSAVVKPVNGKKDLGQGLHATFIIFAICALLVVGALVFRYSLPYIVPYFQDHSIDITAEGHQHHPSASSGYPSVFPPKVSDLERPMSPRRSDHSGKNEPLPGRRGDDAHEEMLIQERSDRWLKENRPDLYEVVRKSSSPKLTDTGSPSRRSLPMQFLLGGLFKSHGEQQEAGHSSRHSNFSEGQDPNASHVSESLDGTPNWWTKVLQGLTKGNTLACDEDPTQYDFPFQDFPRSDGTPCLIYKETPEGMVRVVRSDAPVNNSARPLSPSDMLSNEEFKRVLSLNSEDGVHLETDEMPEEEADMEDEIVFCSPVKSPEFKTKLERLVEMRHRHFERQNILHKHKKTREQRIEEEARQRELKLRRHEMELDVNEIEQAQLSPQVMLNHQDDVGLFTINSPVDDDAMPVVERGLERRQSQHRVTISDPDFYGVASISSSKRTSASLDMNGSFNNIGAIMEIPELGDEEEGGGDVFRSSPPPRPRPSRSTAPTAARKRTASIDNGPYRSGAVASKNLAKARLNRQRSHRRSFSHGTGDTDDTAIKKSASVDCLDGGRRMNGSGNSDDVMTFGIAAYTDFV